MITVRALGASEIRIGRKRIPLSAEVVFALGLYLCTRAGERLTRDELCEVFWGDGRDAAGRHSLRQMLYRLRRQGLTLDEDGEELYLDPARVDSDLNEALKEAWVTNADPSVIESATSLAPGFTRHISERFQDWFDSVRHRLAAQHRRAALRQISVARREGRWADLDKWALQVLSSDPLNEEATLARAESAAMAGSKTIALEIIDAYIEELGDRANVIGLPARVLRRRIAERRMEWVTKRHRELPLVGRGDLMSRLTECVDHASIGRGQVMALWGAPGIGKSRLAQEACAYAEIAGFRCVSVRATVAQSTRPLSILLPLIPLLMELPGAAGCDPAARALLERLRRPHHDRIEFEASTAIGSVSGALLEALADLIDSVVAECKLCLYIDDAHHVDAASWNLLSVLMARTQSQRVLWLHTRRARERELQEPLRSILTMIFVPPLDSASAAQMAESVQESCGHPLSAELIAHVVRTAAGNPLFIQELSARAVPCDSFSALPTSLKELLGSRLDRLDPDSLRLLRITTLLGGLSTLPLVRLLHHERQHDLTDTLERLEDEGILHLSEQRSLELHECWQQAINDDMRGAARASLALHCAEALAVPLPSHDAERTWRAAELFAEGGDAGRALVLFADCSSRMHALGFPAEASSMLMRALPLARNENERSALLIDLARAEYSNDKLELAVDHCTEVLGLQDQHSMIGVQRAATVLCLRADALTKLHRNHLADLKALARLCRDHRLPEEVRQLVCFSGIRLVFNDRTSPLEDLFFHESSELLKNTGPSLLGLLVQLIYYSERGNASMVEYTDTLLAEQPDPASLQMRCMLLRYRGSALRWIGRIKDSLDLFDKAYLLARQSGLLGEASAAAETYAFCCLDTGDLAGARRWIERLEGANRSQTFEARYQSRLHAHSRLLMQEGDYHGALALSEHLIDSLNLDLLAKRKVGWYATVAFCSVATNSVETGITALTRTTEILAQTQPSRFMDYPAELVVRTLSELGREDEAVQFGENYIQSRNAMHNLPIASYFSRLRSLMRAS